MEMTTIDLPLKGRIKRMEAQGRIEPLSGERLKKIPPPIPVLDGIAQKLLREERNNEYKRAGNLLGLFRHTTCTFLRYAQ